MKYMYLAANSDGNTCTMWVSNRDLRDAFAVNHRSNEWQCWPIGQSIILSPLAMMLDLFHVDELDRATHSLYCFELEAAHHTGVYDGSWSLNHIHRPMPQSPVEGLLKQVKAGEGIADAVQYLLEQLKK